MTNDSEPPMFVIPKLSRLCNGRPDPEVSRWQNLVRPPDQTPGFPTAPHPLPGGQFTCGPYGKTPDLCTLAQPDSKQTLDDRKPHATVTNTGGTPGRVDKRSASTSAGAGLGGCAALIHPT
jgi:hypothetical protein